MCVCVYAWYCLFMQYMHNVCMMRSRCEAVEVMNPFCCGPPDPISIHTSFTLVTVTLYMMLCQTRYHPH